MSEVEYSPDWLLQKLSMADHDEIILIAKVLYGIWFFRNKKVWENKTVNSRVTMDWSVKYFADWKLAKASRTQVTIASTVRCQPLVHRWKPLELGSFKLNTDAAIKVGDDTFSIGLVIRDHQGEFIFGKVMNMAMANSVFEAEVAPISEGLHWLSSLPYHNVEIESDSLLAVQALNRLHDNALEVGFVLDECHAIFQSKPGLSISFAKR